MKPIHLLYGVMGLLLTQQAEAQQKDRFTLNGQFKGADSVLIYYVDAAGKQVQVAKPVLKQKFTITGRINKPTNARLIFKKKAEQISQEDFWDRAKEVYLEPGIISVSGQSSDLKGLKVSGSKTQLDLETLNAAVKPIYDEMKPLSDALNKEKDHEKAAEIRDQMEPYNARAKRATYDFFIAHPQSYVTVDMMRYYSSSLRLDSVKRIYQNFNAKLKADPGVKELEKEIKRIELGMPEKVAENFTAKTLDGGSLSLSDFKGKYVIIDFWASWCVPCRKGNPHLIRIYETYKGKGLDVIGISDDDRDHNAWKKAVEKDDIGRWHHVLRGLDMELRMKNLPNPSDISEKYGISSLPTKILIGPDGKIIGRYGDSNGGTDEDLDKKLAALFQ